MPNMPQMKQNPMAKFMDEDMTKKMEAIIHSMTLKERHYPALINGSRKKRLAKGSGTSIQDINQMMKRFTQLQKMLKKFKGGSKMMNKINKLKANLPPGMEGQLPDDFKDLF